MKKISILKKIGVIVAATAITIAPLSAHTVSLGWQVLAGGDVQFFDQHWHGAITSTQNTGLFIDGTEYKFTGIENGVTSRTGLDGAIFNPTYASYDAVTGTLTALSQPNWLTVTVSGLAAGAHTFATTNIALTSWNIPSAGGSITVTLPPPPPPPTTSGVPDSGSSAALLGLGLIGLAAAARRFKK